MPCSSSGGGGGDGDMPVASSDAEQLLIVLQELEEEVFAVTASAEKEEVRSLSELWLRNHHSRGVAVSRFCVPGIPFRSMTTAVARN